MTISIVSRAIAILILSIPAGYIFQEIDDRDWQTMQKYSHPELLAYLESARMPSHLVAVLVVFLVGCGAIACVEVLAWLLRRLLFRSDAPRTNDV